MKKQSLFTLSLVFLLCVGFSVPLNAQFKADLKSSKSSGDIQPAYSYTESTKTLSINMTIYNDGYVAAGEFDVTLFIKESVSGAEIQVDRVTYAGLDNTVYGNKNKIFIEGWSYNLSDVTPAISDGTYRVIVKINDTRKIEELNHNNNNEYFANTSFRYTASTAGLSELKHEESVSVYPNPSKGKFKVIFNDQNVTPKSFSVYNMLGANVSEISNFRQDEIDLSYLPKGVYFMKMNFENNVYTKKLIIE